MKREETRTGKAPTPVGPYSQAVKYGNLVFTAGQIAIDPESGGMVGAGVEKEAEQVLRNLARVLEAAGTNLERALKVTVYLVDLGDFSRVNDVYARFFKPPFPARSCVQVGALPKGARVEIDVVAEV